MEGLSYVPYFVAEPEERELLEAVDAESWRNDLKRRVQHYGYQYDYRARSVDPSMYLGPLPSWAQKIVARLVSAGHFLSPPDQLIVNEYLPGQGISPHIDCEPCFEEHIASLSLGSQCLMDFEEAGGGECLSIVLEPRSLLVFAGEARYEWTYGIAARKSDLIGGHRVTRTRRVSFTFRTIIV
ncbi:MAG: alpha-ketoglutarate-dependent dioxygenase AlkB [Hyphomicrobiaceae bacterium]